MFKKLQLLLCLLVLSVQGYAQSILLEQDVNKDTIVKTFGPNLKNFSHFYYGFGALSSPVEGKGLELNYLLSNEFSLGLRYKRKVNNVYSFGGDLNCAIQSYNITQNNQKTFPDGIVHKKQRLVTRNFGLEFYNRLNFGKRGNYIGNFIDVLAFGQWDFFPTTVTFDTFKTENGILAGKTKQIQSKLSYINPINYGIGARIGFNKFVFYGSYRLSNMFYNSFHFPEVPRLIVGLQLGLHS